MKTAIGKWLTWMNVILMTRTTYSYMIRKHFEYTGSTVAKFILDDLENQLKNFVKVFPKDYKKALVQKRAMP